MKLTIPKKNAGIRADGQKAAAVSSGANGIENCITNEGRLFMAITVNLYYTGKAGNARNHASPMMAKIAALREKYDLQRKQFMERKILQRCRIFSQENK